MLQNSKEKTDDLCHIKDEIIVFLILKSMTCFVDNIYLTYFWAQ